MRYYYKDNNGNYYNFKSEHNDLISITQEEYEEHLQSLKPTNEQKEKIAIKHRINKLKHLLYESDYKAIKYAEGLLSEEEYNPIKIQRQQWRDEINQLEGEN